MADSIPVPITESKDPGFEAALAYMKEQRAKIEGTPEEKAETPSDAPKEENPEETAIAPETPTEGEEKTEEKTEEKAEEPGEKPSKQLLALVKQEKKLRAWKQELRESTEKLKAEVEAHRQKIASVEAKEKELEAFREALHRDPVGTIDEVLKRTSKIGLDELIKTREDPLQRELLETRRELTEIKNSLKQEREQPQTEDRKPAVVTSEDRKAWENYRDHVAHSLEDPKWQYVKKFAETQPARFDRMVFNEVMTFWNEEGHRTGTPLSPTDALDRIESMISGLVSQEQKKSSPLRTLSQAAVKSNPNKERDDDAERFEAARKELRRLMEG